MLKMAHKNGAKTTQNGPKCPQNDPKPRKKVPLRKATLSPCVWTPNSRVAPVGGHITAKKWPKMAPWRLKWAHKGPNQPKMGPNAPKMTPNLGARFPYVRPPYHHVFGPPTPGRCQSAATKLLKMAKNGPKQSQRGPNAPKMNPNLGQRSACVRPPYHHV